jgi:hypothetical protein
MEFANSILIEGAFACCELFHTPAVQYFAAREPPLIYTGFTDETQQTERRSKMNSLSNDWAGRNMDRADAPAVAGHNRSSGADRRDSDHAGRRNHLRGRAGLQHGQFLAYSWNAALSFWGV